MSDSLVPKVYGCDYPRPVLDRGLPHWNPFCRKTFLYGPSRLLTSDVHREGRRPCDFRKDPHPSLLRRQNVGTSLERYDDGRHAL